MSVALCLVLAAAALRAAGEQPAGEQGPGALWARAADYDVAGQLHVGEAGPTGADVTTRLRAALRLEPLWARGDDALLRLTVREAWAETRGPDVRDDFRRRRGPWDQLAPAAWAVHVEAGTIQQFYADPSLPVDFLNYQRAIASLFQFQLHSGEHNETDVSGSCDVLYESVSADVIRKIKRGCSWEADPAAALQCRRVTRVSLHAWGAAGARGVRELFSDEVCALQPADTGLKARGWVSLRSAEPAPPAPPAAASLPAALDALSALGLTPLPLPLQRDPAAAADAPLAPQDLEEALARHGAALRGDEEAGAGGGLPAAHAALELLGALRGAGPAALRAALAGGGPALWALAGAAGTRAVHAAAAPTLREPRDPRAAAYLRGLALAAAPEEEVIRDVLELSEAAKDEEVRRAATLAAGAAAGAAGAGGGGAARDVLAALRRRLVRCGDDACRELLLRALANTRGDVAAAALPLAEAGAEPVSAAALRALQAAPPAALDVRALLRLARLALTASRPLGTRGAALRLAAERALRRDPPVLEVAVRLAAGLAGAAPADHELRRVLWGSLAALPPAAVATLLRMLPPHARCWPARANAGTSSVLERETGWEAGGWRASLTSVQLAGGGVLRRGGVVLRGKAAGGEGGAGGRDLLDVEVWTRGLQAWGGGAGGGSEAEEEAAAGLTLSVGGVALSDVTLFSSQAELLSLLWAGAGSSDTAVLRAAAPLWEARAATPLATQGALLHARARAASVLALDAAASVSLWGRTAAARLRLRAAAALHGALVAAGRGGVAEGRARAGAAGELAVAADLDFYGDVALCVRAALSSAAPGRELHLRAAAGSPRHELRRRRSTARSLPGRTLSLGRENDATCRTLGADL